MTLPSSVPHRRRQLLKLFASSIAAGGLSACGGGSGGAVSTPPVVTPPTSTPPATVPVTPPVTTPVTPPVTSPVTPPVTSPDGPPLQQPAPATKSAKRGIAYDLASAADLDALSPGVSWWYNWGARPNSGVPSDYVMRYGMDYYPILWNGQFDAAAVTAFLAAHPEVGYLLLMNEPNLTDQANLTPQQAAQIWPGYEAIASNTGVKLVGPAITWGTMNGYADPVAWLDAFYAAYQAANGGRNPHIDYLAFHWYDYGLGAQLDRLSKYGKPFWVTEMANWHSQNDGAQIDTPAKQQAQMTDMVATCESRADVFRYAWFTGRISPDPHFDSLLGADGQLTALGQLYVSLPFAATPG